MPVIKTIQVIMLSTARRVEKSRLSKKYICFLKNEHESEKIEERFLTNYWNHYDTLRLVFNLMIVVHICSDK